MSTENTSLDEPSEEFFYYAIDGFDKIYKIPIVCLSLVPLLQSMHSRNQYNSEQNPIILTIVKTQTSHGKTIYVNHPDHHDFLQEYLLAWKDDISHEDYLAKYINEGVYFKPLLLDKDKNLIINYINMKTNNRKVSAFTETDLLGPLVATINGFLLIEGGLKNKLYGYISDNIREYSYVDVKNLMDDNDIVAEFEYLQQESLRLWLAKNPDKQDKHLASSGDM